MLHCRSSQLLASSSTTSAVHRLHIREPVKKHIVTFEENHMSTDKHETQFDGAGIHTSASWPICLRQPPHRPQGGPKVARLNTPANLQPKLCKARHNKQDLLRHGELSTSSHTVLLGSKQHNHQLAKPSAAKHSRGLAGGAWGVSRGPAANSSRT